jgi:hypothetical protein
MFLEIGGLSFPLKNRLSISSTSFSYVSSTLSYFYFSYSSILFLVIMFLNLFSKSNAPSDDVSFSLKVVLIMLIVSSSIYVIEWLNPSKIIFQLSSYSLLNTSLGNYSNLLTHSLTLSDTMSIYSESPVTALRSGPNKEKNSFNTVQASLISCSINFMCLGFPKIAVVLLNSHLLTEDSYSISILVFVNSLCHLSKTLYP